MSKVLNPTTQIHQSGCVVIFYMATRIRKQTRQSYHYADLSLCCSKHQIKHLTENSLSTQKNH